MKRIAKENAYYAFAVPTATWLVLSVPGQLLKKIQNVYTKVQGRFGKRIETRSGEPGEASADEEPQPKNDWLSKFAIRGHGYQPGFFKCLRSWGVGSWEKTLSSNGFTVVRKAPLLTYGSSNLPVIPPNRFLAELGLSSSFLFICREAHGVS